jgi:hypothetical protein
MHFITPLEMLLIQGADELSMEIDRQGLALETFEKIDTFFFKNSLTKNDFLSLSSPVRELSLQSRITWTASIRIALSGQPYAATPLLRTALEAACYASLINSDSSLETVWINRNNDVDSEKKSRKIFSPAVSNVSKLISKVSTDLGESISEAYDECIDDGAHPNTKGIPRSPTLVVSQGRIDNFDQTSDFYGRPSLKTKYALASIAKIGLLNCQIVSLLTTNFEDLPISEIEEINSGIEALYADLK